MRTLNSASIAAVLLAAGAAGLRAQAVQPGFATPARQGGANIAAGTSMAFAPDGRLFVAQQGGQVKVIKNGALLGTSFLELSVNSADERGLLGIAFDPDYAVNRFFYVFYTRSGSTTNRVARYVASAASPDLRDAAVAEDVLLDIPTGGGTPAYHNGGALHFGIDGKLFVAVGEGHQSANAQNPANIYGKLLRLNPDGSIPSDNPTSFQGVATALGAPSAVWCIGLRNPFTFAVQPGSGRIFINDVGQDQWEEINDGIAGRNYGWSGGTTDGRRSSANFTDSVFEYPHSGATPSGNVITGGAFYNPGVVQYPASYVGKYFFADSGTGNFIYVLDPAAAAVAPFVAAANNPVDLDVGPDGALYYLARGGANPGVYRVAYTAVAAQGIVVSTDKLPVGEGAVSAFNVRLAANPGATVVVDVARTLGDASVTAAPPTLTFNGSTWQVDQPVTVTAAQDDGDASDDGATITLSSAGLESRTVAVTAVDNDDDPGAPVVRIALPVQGQSVSGTQAEFYGHATDATATTQATFYIDGGLAYTDANTLGHYHFGGGHAGWNTTGLADGPHVLQMRVSDGTSVGIHEITVLVSNGSGGGGGAGGGGGCGLTGAELALLLAALSRAKRRLLVK
jgi:glucose/arabinose dehydrogenase